MKKLDRALKCSAALAALLITASSSAAPADEPWKMDRLSLDGVVKGFNRYAAFNSRKDLALDKCSFHDIPEKPLRSFMCPNTAGGAVLGIVGKDGKLRDISLRFDAAGAQAVHDARIAATYLLRSTQRDGDSANGYLVTELMSVAVKKWDTAQRKKVDGVTYSFVVSKEALQFSAE
jgi:hypothetical protein